MLEGGKVYQRVVIDALRGSRLPQLLIEVNLERSTWQLLYALYTDRVEAESHGDDEDMITDIMVMTKFMYIMQPSYEATVSLW